MVPEAVITEMARLIGTLIDRLGDPATVKGVCVTVPGIVSKQGDLVRAPSIAWRNIPVYALLSQKLNYQGPLLIENDANAFAASELYRSSEKGRQNALCIFIDTGIGGAILHHGKLMRGHRGYAGEIGHIFIGDQGFSTFSSLSGTFESFSGDRAILERYRTKGGTGTTIRHFTQLVSAGEPAALETLDEWAYWLGRGLASLISVLDPETIAIGGAVAILYSLAEAKVHASIKQHLFEGHPLPSIHISDLEEDAPAIGGAAILHRDFLAIDETIVFGRSSTVG
jgi:predicted NBD/HSP70 family sugar kinase